MNTNWNDPNFQGFKGQNPFHREGHTPKPRKAVGTDHGSCLPGTPANPPRCRPAP